MSRDIAARSEVADMVESGHTVRQDALRANRPLGRERLGRIFVVIPAATDGLRLSGCETRSVSVMRTSAACFIDLRTGAWRGSV